MKNLLLLFFRQFVFLLKPKATPGKSWAYYAEILLVIMENL